MNIDNVTARLEAQKTGDQTPISMLIDKCYDNAIHIIREEAARTTPFGMKPGELNRLAAHIESQVAKEGGIRPLELASSIVVMLNPNELGARIMHNYHEEAAREVEGVMGQLVAMDFEPDLPEITFAVPKDSRWYAGEYKIMPSKQ